LRAAPETHLGLTDVARMAAESGIAATRVGLARQLETLAEYGLLGRLPTTTAEPVFDTVPEPHSHLVYEDTAQTFDLQVSSETLLAILGQALRERPDEVEILIRFRASPVTTARWRQSVEQLCGAKDLAAPPLGEQARSD
jgi:Fe2+ or Zn2+ uptake regulation protein